jgi:hypothetical protein
MPREIEVLKTEPDCVLQARAHLEHIQELLQNLDNAETEEDRESSYMELCEYPLEIRTQKEETDYRMETSYIILLCTGGPAVRVYGQKDFNGIALSARLQAQDWFTPWEDVHLTKNEHETIVDFANFYLEAY